MEEQEGFSTGHLPAAAGLCSLSSQVAGALYTSLFAVEWPEDIAALCKFFEMCFNFAFLNDLLRDVSIRVSVEGLSYPIRTLYKMFAFLSFCLAIPLSYALLVKLLKPSTIRKERFSDQLIGWLIFVLYIGYPVLAADLLRLFDEKRVGSGTQASRWRV